VKFEFEVGTVDARLIEGGRKICDRLLAIKDPRAVSGDASFRLGLWDGKIHFFDKETLTFPAGLFWRLAKRLDRRGHELFASFPDTPDVTPITKDYLVGVDLRDFQIEGVNTCLEKKRGILWFATNSGKSLVLSAIAGKLVRDAKLKVLVIVPNAWLLNQTSTDIKKYLGPDVRVGRAGDGQRDLSCDILVSTYQTLLSTVPNRSKKIGYDHELASFLKRCGGVIVDECFPGWVRVGYVPIADVRVGDLVPAFDETTGNLVSRRVSRVMRRRPTALVRIWLSDGTTLPCTPDHPIWVQGVGWVAASRLRVGLRVLSYGHGNSNDLRPVPPRERETTASLESPAVLPDMPGGARDRAEEVTFTDVPLSHVRCAARGHERAETTAPSCRIAGSVFGRVHADVSSGTVVCADGLDEPAVREFAHDPTQSDAVFRDTPAGIRDAYCDGAPSYGSRWERDGHDGSAAEAFTGTPRSSRWVDSGVRGADGRPNTGDATDELPAGSRVPRTASERRGGRRESLHIDAAGVRPSARRIPEVLTVDRVEVLQSGRDGTFGGCCPDGYVYNLEVEEVHTYLAEGVVVHNCHHAGSPAYADILKVCSRAAYRIGCTGSADKSDRRVGLRGDDKAKEHRYRMESYIGPILLRVTNQDLIDEGFSAKPRIVVINDRTAFGPVIRFARQNPNAKRKVNPYLRVFEMAAIKDRTWLRSIAKVVDALLTQGKPPFIFSHSVPHVEAIGAALTARGIPCEVLHGNDSTYKRREVVDRFSRDKNFAVVTSPIFDEGASIPAIHAVVFAGARKAAVELLQRIGRGLRAKAGADNTVIVVDFDPVHSTMLHGQFEAREAAYRDEGFPIRYLDDISALHATAL
jgi:superfamily II DNA or RNA helicase